MAGGFVRGPATSRLGLTRGTQRIAHAHQVARRQRPGRSASRPSSTTSRTGCSRADASVLTEYRGLTVTDLAALRAALRPASTDYKVYKNTLARRAAADAGFTEMAELLEGPVAIAFVRARRRRGDRGQGAARLRQDQPEPRREGRDARAAGADRRRRRGAGRRAAPRSDPRPPRRWVPGAAREGGRPVPGVHPQLRLRPQGLHRHPPRRRLRGAAAGETAQTTRRSREPAADRRSRSETRRQPLGRGESDHGSEDAEARRQPRPPKHETEATTGEAN